MKAIAVATIFLCLFIVSSVQGLQINCQEAPPIDTLSCLERIVSASTSDEVRDSCRDCKNVAINFISQARCTSPSTDEIRQCKSELILHGMVTLLQLTL